LRVSAFVFNRSSKSKRSLYVAGSFGGKKEEPEGEWVDFFGMRE
jgi:hypothetical protein